MKTNVLVWLLLSSIVLMPSAAAARQAADAPGLVRVTGRVLDAVNAQPLPGVAITVDGVADTTVTDMDGRYALRLSPGTYTVRVAMDGFTGRALSVVVEGDRVIEPRSLAIAGYTKTSPSRPGW